MKDYPNLRKNEWDTEFWILIRDIVSSDEFKKMKRWQHHIKGSVYDHSVKVAYLCYKHHKRFSLKVDIEEFVKGAVLHDYYLYDLHGGNEKHAFHWFTHSATALKNAMEKYPELTEIQQDMIRRHMFPLTLVPPKTSAAWLLCFYDKVAALSDCFGNSRRKSAV